MTGVPAESESKSPIREIIQPFADLLHAPRALWGINLAYFIEGMAYFGMLTYLAIYFSDYVFQGVENPDVHSHHMVMVLTAGITIAMFVFGFIPDKIGVRPALILALMFFLAGRIVISAAPALGLQPAGLWSPLQLVTVAGILLIVIGYGMYQPAAYAAVRQFTTPKSAAMGFAMLYALMNLGGYIPSFFGFVRERIGITGAFWVYTGCTVVSLVSTILILTSKTVAHAIAEAKAAREADSATAGTEANRKSAAPVTSAPERPAPPVYFIDRVLTVIRSHPLRDPKFSYFIFCLIPVQTLFAYNWLILPQYVERAYRGGWIGQYYEFAVNFNPLLIFIFVPIVTAISQKRKVYNMMIAGTFVMAAPAFLLSIGPTPWTLFGYIFIMTIGEAMWQPRFLQYAAEIAPEGRTGQYIGVAQLPWFLTKFLVPIYSGHVLGRYCPPEGPQDTKTMWLIFGCIAVVSPILLVAARKWIGRDFKTKHDT